MITYRAVFARRNFLRKDVLMLTRTLFMPAVLAVALLAGPALAQSANTSNTTKDTAQPMSQKPSGQVQEQLRQSLTKSGFTEIRIQPEAFIVRAKASDGSPMVMMISPDQVTEVVDQSGTSTPPTLSGASSNSGPSTPTGKAQTPADSGTSK
jgi:hypothetical protein